MYIQILYSRKNLLQLQKSCSVSLKSAVTSEKEINVNLNSHKKGGL